MKDMNMDITFCGYEQCSHTDCMRYYKNSKSNRDSWFAVRPKDDEHCDYYIKGESHEN